MVPKNDGRHIAGRRRTVKTNYINPFPLPEKVSAASEKKLSKLTKSLIAAKAKATKPEKIAELESEINTAVYALYGLDDDDVAVIENTLNPDLVLA